jgi:hypothetical protein
MKSFSSLYDIVSRAKWRAENQTEPTYWSGKRCHAVRCNVIVADADFPGYWARPFVGQVRKAVRVMTDASTFYIDNEDGSGWAKVTKGFGSPSWGHGSLAVGMEVP